MRGEVRLEFIPRAVTTQCNFHFSSSYLFYLLLFAVSIFVSFLYSPRLLNILSAIKKYFKKKKFKGRREER